jgi:sterol desaturase/sphingolipid hydroxylase (fatty acid hydroxylase superfamily)
MGTLSEFVLLHESLIRFAAFCAIFAAMAAWELLAPRRILALTRSRRWLSNLGVMVLDTLLVRLILPAAIVGGAVFAGIQGWGLLNYLNTPAWFGILVAVVMLDLAIYLQHVLFHAVPALWRVHRMHHADLDFDVTTGVRFHPIEIVLSVFIKLGVVVALGLPGLGVLLFEVLLNATSLFNHSNVRIPSRIERVLRWLVVTPDMHRVHHSIDAPETNSNFGFNLPWWDRLFGTYRAQPRRGHNGMTLGIKALRDPDLCASFVGLLRLPFMGATQNYPLGRR